MLLCRSPEQEAALNSLLESQQNPSSPQFHQWLTPEQVGQQFGPAKEDIQAVSDWLASHGFTNISLSKAGTVIEFSGNASQVESAFHTEIHRYEVNGAMHLANDRDPSIPTALAPVVAGVVSLNDLGRRSMAIRGPALRETKGQPRPERVPGANPDLTLKGPTLLSSFFGVAPYDFATIYDLLPLWNAGFDGTGQAIAIVGETDINPSDPAYFRAFLGLPKNDPTVIIAGADPGFQADELESDLDVEWAGAVARGAHIELVSAASTETTAGVDLAALYIIDNNLAPVISESYGDCELFLGTTGNAFEKAMWQQAAAEGITVLVSSGDQGSAACDPTGPNQNLAIHPMAVSGLASTPYNVAVGGTDFNQYSVWTNYWSLTSDPTTKESALGYIPEVPWNDSCGSSVLDATTGDNPVTACNNGAAGSLYLDTIATSGGPSSCVTSSGTSASSCASGWPKPIWQAGSGVPADGVRDVPDVSLFASNGVYNSAYIVCDANATAPVGNCDPSSSSQYFVAVGGTSASTPAMAGVMAIINQKYGRQGNANFTLYRLASSAQRASIFHDVATDGNRVACTSLSSDCEIPAGAAEPIGRMKGHDSTIGYDMVTGLGSVDIANLVNNWSSIAFTPTNTTLDLNGGIGTVTAIHGTAINAVVDVRASSGSPTGDVSLLGTTESGSIYLGSLQSGAITGQVNSFPGGNYKVTAHYAGDTQFAPSDSAEVSVSISPEASTTKVTILNYNTSTGVFGPPPASVPYGSLLLLRADVKGQSGYGNATGSATFTDGINSLGQFAINAQSYTEDIPSNLLLAGSHTVNASYGGDPSFNASSGTASITVTPAQMSCNVTANTTILRPGWNLVLNPYALLYQAKLAATLGNMVAPTGTISVYSGSTLIAGPTTVTGNGSGSLSGGAFQLPSATIAQLTLQVSQLPSPIGPIAITYSGDSNYASCTSAPLTLTYSTAPVPSQTTFSLSAYGGILGGTPVNMIASIIATTLPPPSEPSYPTPAGTVQLAIDGTNVGSPLSVTAGPNFGAELTGAANLTIPTAGLAGGNHVVTLRYGGDSNYLASTSGDVIIGIVVPDFTISVNPNNLSVTNGQTTTPTVVQVGYQNGFLGTVNFSCSGLPTGAACVFSPNSVSGSGSASLTLTTAQAQSVSAGPTASNRPRHIRWIASLGSISAAFVVFVAVPVKRRKNLLLAICATGSIFIGVASCGGGGGGGSTTSPTQYSTSTALTASSKTPSKGSMDTFTATVKAIGSTSAPSGTVQFSVDGANSGSPVGLTNGTSQFRTSFSTAGAHTVTAAYSGDTADLSSKSSAYSVTVPYTTGSLPGSYAVTVTAASGSVTHSTILNLLVQ
ncbi:MAG: Ig-like domain repeat protein [Terracidiphilus sp.]